MRGGLIGLLFEVRLPDRLIHTLMTRGVGTCMDIALHVDFWKILGACRGWKLGDFWM